MNQTAYTNLILQLMASGAAWSKETCSNLHDLRAALAAEPARIHDRATQLIIESDPHTTAQLLPDFERVCALPDPCHGNNQVILFSPVLSDQIPRSHGARAFNDFQQSMFVHEITQLCAS